MQVVILCGGKGTRMGANSVPKPLVEVGGEPIVVHVMRGYERFGFDEFILAVGWRGDEISSRISSEYDFNVQFVDTGEDTLTGGRVYRLRKQLHGDFMVTYADGLADIDINALVSHHRAQRKVATITCVQPRSQFGIAKLNDEGLIAGFMEKPVLDHWVNGGFFCFTQGVFEYLDDNSVLEGEPFEALARQGEMVAFKHDGFWQCMDTYKDNIELNQLADSTRPWILRKSNVEI